MYAQDVDLQNLGSRISKKTLDKREMRGSMLKRYISTKCHVICLCMAVAYLRGLQDAG